MATMPSASAYDDKVRLYALADPALFAEQSDAITRFVFEALQVAPSDRHRVYVSPSSAWLQYTALDEVWDRRAPPALARKADALKAAEELLTRLQQRCSDTNRAWPGSLRGMALLPPVGMLRRAGLYAVPRPDGSAWDHWLYRAEPQLALDGGLNRVGVFGAQVEIRIGHRGQPISLRSRWSPLSGEIKPTKLSPFQLPPDGEADAGNSEEGGGRSPLINFLLEGDGIPQYYLAPYYFLDDGDSMKMFSASPFSLTVDVRRSKQGASRMTLTALALGGSGDYVYNWALYSLARVENGIQEIGQGSSIEIDNGNYVALVNVKDRATGAFKHHQQQVFSGPFRFDSTAERTLPQTAGRRFQQRGFA